MSVPSSEKSNQSISGFIHEEEILNKIKFYLNKAKEDLNNDLTKLAVKGLPLVYDADQQIKDYPTDPSDIEGKQDTEDIVHKVVQSASQEASTSLDLEPLDLDL